MTLPDLGMAVATGFLGGLSVGVLVGAAVGVAALRRGSLRVQLIVAMATALALVGAVVWPLSADVFLATPIIWGAGVVLAAWLAIRFKFPLPALGVPRRLLFVGIVSLVSGVLGLALLANSTAKLSPAAEALQATETSQDDIGTADVLLDASSSKPTRMLAIEGGEPYEIRITCDGPSAQISEGYVLPDRVYGVRRIMPCNGSMQPGAMARAPEGTTVEIFVDATGSTFWRLTVTR